MITGSIDCPYCLTPQSFHKGDNCESESCGKKVPRQYIEIARKQPPIWIVTYGPTQHGKTTLLGSIAFILERLGQIVPRAFHTYLDDFTVRRIAEMQRGQLAGMGSLGPTAPNDRPEPLIIALKNFPTPNESRVFVIFDLAGEVVDEITCRITDDSSDPPLYARAVSKAQTVWFVVSLYDIQKDTLETGKSINNLFFAYQQTMGQLNVPLQNRKILVTYTKADLLMKPDQINLLKMPPPLYDYMSDDPYSDFGNRGAAKPDLLDVDAYSANLEHISDQLREFTEYDVPGGSAFVAMAEDSDTEMVFTINAAQPGGKTGVQIERIRVIDPLLWTMILTNGDGDKAAAALILPIQNNTTVYSDNWPVITYDILRAHNLPTSTFFMGQVRMAYPAGNAPVDPVPSTMHPPLIGSILEQLPVDSVAVVLVDDELPLDINDFVYTGWEDRLLLIGSSEVVHQAHIKWKYQAQSQSEIEQIIREFTQQLRLRQANT